MSMVGVPHFDHAEVDVDELAEIGNVETADGVGAARLQAFLRLTAADRAADTRHVHNCYCDVRENFDRDDELDVEMGALKNPEDVWAHVQPTEIYLETRRDDPHRYLVVSCRCAWEEEHGLSLVWRDGSTCCEAGPGDGHVTDVDAHADPGLADVVYEGIDAAFRTYLTR